MMKNDTTLFVGLASSASFLRDESISDERKDYEDSVI